MLWVNRPDFDAYVDAAFGQIRRVARDNVHVTYHLMYVLTELERVATGERALAVRREIDRVLRQVSESDFDEVDLQRVRTLTEVSQ